MLRWRRFVRARRCRRLLHQLEPRGGRSRQQRLGPVLLHRRRTDGGERRVDLVVILVKPLCPDGEVEAARAQHPHHLVERGPQRPDDVQHPHGEHSVERRAAHGQLLRVRLGDQRTEPVPGPREHGAGQVDAHAAHAVLAERQGDAARADPDLEDLRRQPRRDGGGEVAGPCLAASRLVIAVGHAVEGERLSHEGA